jgi:hypothetical protein
LLSVASITLSNSESNTASGAVLANASDDESCASGK